MPQESLTILQPTNKRPLTKIISDNQKGGYKISTAGLSKNFRSWQVKVNSIHDLAKELTKIHVTTWMLAKAASTSTKL